MVRCYLEDDYVAASMPAVTGDEQPLFDRVVSGMPDGAFTFIWSGAVPYF